jgi:hypothetical protein
VSSLESDAGRYAAVDAVAGLLAAAAIALSAIAIVERPARYAPVAIVLALIAVRMSVRFQRLALVAAVAGMVGWVLGMSFAVTTDNPLF